MAMRPCDLLGGYHIETSRMAPGKKPALQTLSGPSLYQKARRNLLEDTQDRPSGYQPGKVLHEAHAQHDYGPAQRLSALTFTTQSNH